MHEGARSQKQAARIDVHDAIVFLVGNVLDRPRLRPDARVVDEDVDATECIHGLLAQTLRRLAVADVMLKGDRLALQALRGFFDDGAVDISQHDRSARSIQPLGDTEPDAARSTSDDGNASVKISHDFSPLVIFLMEQKPANSICSADPED